MAESTPVSESRVVVRPWHRRRDRAVINRWPPYTPALPAHWVATSATERHERVSYAVELRSDRALVGRIGLQMYALTGAYLGIALHPAHLGNGLGREALHLISQLGPRIGLSVLRLDVADENTRAIRCYQRAGFVEVGAIWRNGYRYLDMVRAL